MPNGRHAIISEQLHIFTQAPTMCPGMCQAPGKPAHSRRALQAMGSTSAGVKHTRARSVWARLCVEDSWHPRASPSHAVRQLTGKFTTRETSWHLSIPGDKHLQLVHRWKGDKRGYGEQSLQGACEFRLIKEVGKNCMIQADKTGQLGTTWTLQSREGKRRGGKGSSDCTAHQGEEREKRPERDLYLH